MWAHTVTGGPAATGPPVEETRQETHFCGASMAYANIQTVYFPASPLAANSPHP